MNPDPPQYLYQQIYYETGPTARPSFQLRYPPEPRAAIEPLHPDWLPSASRQRRNRTPKARRGTIGFGLFLEFYVFFRLFSLDMYSRILNLR